MSRSRETLEKNPSTAFNQGANAGGEVEVPVPVLLQPFVDLGRLVRGDFVENGRQDEFGAASMFSATLVMISLSHARDDPVTDPTIHRAPGNKRKGGPTVLFCGSTFVVQESRTRPAGACGPASLSPAFATSGRDPETGMERIVRFGKGGVVRCARHPATMNSCPFPAFRVQSCVFRTLTDTTGNPRSEWSRVWSMTLVLPGRFGAAGIACPLPIVHHGSAANSARY